MKSLRVAVASLALWCVWPAEDAHAYCRSRVDSRDAAKQGPSIDPNTGEQSPCFGVGPELFWRSRCISYQLYPKARAFSIQDATTAVAEAFAKWTQSSCELDGAQAERGDSRVSLDVRYLGETDCAAAGEKTPAPGEAKFNLNGPNQNVLIFRDSTWSYFDAQDGLGNTGTLGLTTVTYSKNTGEIFDADIEFNTFEQPLKLGNVGGGDYDLASIITHEIGHFLGIAHTDVLDATMYSVYSTGETKKQHLKFDDIQAICEAYPPSGARRVNGELIPATSCDPTPVGGAQRACLEVDGGCAVGRGGAEEGGHAGLWLIGAVVVGTCGAARRRARRR